MKRAIQMITSDPAWKQGGDMAGSWMQGGRFPMCGTVFYHQPTYPNQHAPGKKSTFNFMECLENSDTRTGVIESRKKWRLLMDADGFSHENITINVRGRELTVEAKKEDSAKRKLEFTRQYQIPEYVKTNSLKSILDTSEGVLQLEGDKTNGEMGEGEKTIPIKFSVEDQK